MPIKKFSKWVVERDAIQEAENLGLGTGNPSWKEIGKEAAISAGKAAIGLAPVIGSLTEVGEFAWKVIQMFRRGRNVRPMIRQMLDMRDKNPGVPNNAFDLPDEISDKLSDKAKMELTEKVVNKLEDLLNKQQQIPSDLATKEAYKYMLATFKQVMQKVSQTPAAAPQPQAAPQSLAPVGGPQIAPVV